MATRSTITARFSSGLYACLYCHYDGYLEGVGKTLKEHYTSEDKIVDLFKLRDLRCLENSPELCEELDDGEYAQTGQFFEDVQLEACQEFEYFWNAGVWYYREYGDTDFKEL